MDDVVALRTETDTGQVRYWMTWGRLFDPVDPAPMIAAIRPHLRYSDRAGEIVTIELCDSLQDAADQPYFFESLLSFAMQPIPFGDDYERWVSEKKIRQAEGRDLHYLGDPEHRSRLGG